MSELEGDRAEFDAALFEDLRVRTQRAEERAKTAELSEAKWRGKLQSVTNTLANLEPLMELAVRIDRVERVWGGSGPPVEQMRVKRDAIVKAIRVNAFEPSPTGVDHALLAATYVSVAEHQKALATQLELLDEQHRGEVRKLELRIENLTRARGEAAAGEARAVEARTDEIAEHQRTRDLLTHVKDQIGALRIVFEQLIDDARGFDGPLAETVRRRCRRVLDRRIGRWSAKKLLREMAAEDRNPGSGQTS